MWGQGWHHSGQLFHLLKSDLDLQTDKCVVDGVRCPGKPLAVSEKRACWVTEHEPTRDLQRGVGQVDDSRKLLTLALLGRKHPSGVRYIDVASFDDERLLRPSGSFPSNHEQVRELLAWHQLQERFELLGTDDHATLTRTWLFVMGQRRLDDVAFFLCPRHRALHGTAHSVFRAARPVRVGRQPVIKVIGLEIRNKKVARNGLREHLQAPPVPFVRFCRSMFATPDEKLVNQVNHHRRSDCGGWLLGFVDQLLVRFERLFFVRP